MGLKFRNGENKMLEEIKKEFDKFPIKKILYDTDEGQTFIAELIAVDKRNLWQFIEQKLTEAIKQAKIEENEMWLAHANRFSNDVPNSLKRINRSELKDRINELKGE